MSHLCAGKLQRMEQEQRSFVDDLSELRPRLDASEARATALEDELTPRSVMCKTC